MEIPLEKYLQVPEDLPADIEMMRRSLALQYAMTWVLSDSPNLTDATPRLLQMICEGLGWEAGETWHVYPDSNELRWEGVWHIQSPDMEEFVNVSRTTTFMPGIGLPGRVWASGEPTWIRDVTEDDNFPRAPFAAKAGLHGAFAFPITDAGRITGVMAFFSRHVCDPDSDLMNMMAVIGSRIGQFIERKRGEERITQEMEITSSLLMISDATAHTTDINKLMEQVVNCQQGVMGCDMSLAYLWEKEHKIFRANRSFNLPHEMVPTFMTNTLDKEYLFIKMVLGRKGPVVVEPYHKAGMEPAASEQAMSQFIVTPISDQKYVGLETRTIPWLNSVNTMLVIPLFGKTGSLGLLINIYKEARKFKERDRKIIEGVSRQVSLALEEAESYKKAMEWGMDLAHKMETIQVFHEIDRSILSTLESQEILDTAIRSISRIIPCDKAMVLLVDMECDGFRCASGCGASFAPKDVLLPFSDTSASDVVKSGRAHYEANLAKLSDIKPLENGFLKEGFLSHIRVPLIVKGEPVGILSVGAKRAAAFTAENLSTLEKLAFQIGIALENTKLLTDRQELFFNMVRTLSHAIDAKSPWTNEHSERVTEYALFIGREMGFNRKMLDDLKIAGLFHDIGKIATYDELLNKPARLTDDEYIIVKQHTLRGEEILQPLKQLRHITPWIRSHHEYYDGTGYPDGLKGEDIPLNARILAVADAFDSMTSERPYRETPGIENAVVELKKCSGTQFDPRIVEVFLKTLPKETGLTV